MIPITANEISRSVYGAFRLACFDPKGLDWFEPGLDGFWKSFWAAVLIAPFYGALSLLRFIDDRVAAGFVRYFSVEILAYVISWVLFPLVMIHITKLLDVQRNFLRFITAYNWAAVIQNGVHLPILILAEIGLVPQQGATFLSLMIIGMVLVYLTFITQTALELPYASAVGIVVLDVLVSVFINGFTVRLVT